MQDSIISTYQPMTDTQDPMQLANYMISTNDDALQIQDQGADYLKEKFKATFDGIEKQHIIERDSKEIATKIQRNLKNSSYESQMSKTYT